MHPQIKTIQDMAKQGQYQQSLAKLDQLDQQLQNEGDALYLRAVCLRAVDRRNDALQILRKVLEKNPSHVRAYQEIGHIHVSRKNADKAIEGYAEAVRRDPALLSSWQPLVTLYKIIGKTDLMQLAQRHVDSLSALPQALVAAKSALNQGKIDAADVICREFLQDNKQHVDGMRLLAEIVTQAQILDDAEFILESAVEFEPEHIGARFDLATILLKRQKFGKADEIATELATLQPDNLDFRTLLGSTRLGVGDTDKAIEIFGQLAQQKYLLTSTYLLLGHAHKTAGNLQSAIEAYQNLYRHQPDYGDAFWSLANTKTYQFNDQEIAHMLDYQQGDTTSAANRVHFSFALGKAYEDRKEFDTSFNYYAQGNTLNQQLLSYDAPDMVRRAQRQKEVCTTDLFAALQGVGHAAADPIFIVGLPRAGSTLLEQILASHSQIDGTHELPNILSLARRLRGRAAPQAEGEPNYPKILAELDPDYFRRFGEQFIEDTKIFRQGAPLFIDKMPNNFLHLGLIKLILPNAKIIDARRHPMSCCFSGFKQLFAEGQEFTYGLNEIGSYYKAYVDLMEHWDQVLPGFVLHVQHEDVVNDLDTQVRRMLEFCNVPFEEACLKFHQTERNIRTPSSEQVRQPIYRTGLEQWKNFEPWLEPLKEALGQPIREHYSID
ncbi:MAG: tetratricopeptide (TPR) repeat protein [Arenicella sp.]|jgi:tetratricopeptide (TPR) repeat protein